MHARDRPHVQHWIPTEECRGVSLGAGGLSALGRAQPNLSAVAMFNRTNQNADIIRNNPDIIRIRLLLLGLVGSDEIRNDERRGMTVLCRRALAVTKSQEGIVSRITNHHFVESFFPAGELLCHVYFRLNNDLPKPFKPHPASVTTFIKAVVRVV